MAPITPANARYLLTEAGVTQRMVSKRAGICEQYISEWLNGKRLFDSTTMAELTAYFEKLKLIV